MLQNQLWIEIDRVCSRYRRVRFWRAMTVGWLLAAIGGGFLMVTGFAASQELSATLPLLGIIAVMLVGASIAFVKATAPSHDWVARQIEAQHSELKSCLLAAIEQRPNLADGRFGFLQESVIRQTLHHAESHDWPEVVPARRIAAAILTQYAALAVFLVTLTSVSLQRSTALAVKPSEEEQPTAVAGEKFSVEVEPGNTEIERGSSLLVLARIRGEMPAEAVLVFQSVGGDATNSAMSRSLNDPVFGGSIASVTQSLEYHVELGKQSSATFRVTVFEYPRLERADARLVYPSYTGLEQKLVQDVRSVSVVEGTQVTLIFQLNKRVQSASLTEKSKEPTEPISLVVAPGEQPVYQTSFTADKSRRWKLELIDDAGRKNVEQAEIAIQVVPNQPPTLKLVQPARDLEVSPLEELDLKATAWDDFGVKRAGLSFAIAGQPSVDVTLNENSAARQKHELANAIKLEELNAQPDQLLSYHFWAEDFGPDGNVRRTASDMYFAEVRHFEEIFRQGQQPPGGQQQQQQQNSPAGQQAQQLAQSQKEIINATWKLIRREVGLHLTPSFGEDVEQLVQAQNALLEKAKALAEKVSDEQSREHVTAVIEAMLQAIKQLMTAHEMSGTALAAGREQKTPAASAEPLKDNAAAPLQPALLAEQSAYQALLKLRAREHEVVRQQQQQQQQQSSGQQSQSESRSQQQRQQMQQLDLKEEENRYESQKLARSQPESEQDRETRQVLNRLRELARRQNDLNDRMKELQTALQEAPTPEKREEIKQQLKRLKEEQQQILRDTDELQSRMETAQNQEGMAEERQQLEETRDQVRKASEALEQGQVIQAAAAGTRAQEQFEELRNEFRRRASNRFNEEMREMRDNARELDREQKELSEKIAEVTNPEADTKSDGKPATKSLRGEDRTEQLQKGLTEQRERLSNLSERMKQTIQEAEQTEPLLTERLYEAARNAQSQNVERALDATGRALRQGLAQETQKLEQIAGQGITQLREGVEKAAEAVLGDETESLRRAREELKDLAKELTQEIAKNAPSEAAQLPQPKSDGSGSEQQESRGEQAPKEKAPGKQSKDGKQGPPQPGQPGQNGQSQSGQQPQPGQSQPGQRTAQRGSRSQSDPNGRGGTGAIDDTVEQASAPIGGEDFLKWSDRLRDVEEMVNDPELRAEAARIRDQARAIRAEMKRHSKEPNWGLVRVNVAEPLVELSNRVTEELLRRNSKQAIVPLDRDPVPPKYSEKTRRYYERLGSGR